jgi:hypothetical protein
MPFLWMSHGTVEPATWSCTVAKVLPIDLLRRKLKHEFHQRRLHSVFFNRMKAVRQAYVDNAPEYQPMVPAMVVFLEKAGLHMESTANELATLNTQVQESKRILQELSNEVGALQELLQPRLLSCINDIRSLRMTLVTETQQVLSSLRDVRKFLFEAEYKDEIARLENVTALCERLKQFKDDGTLDAISDLAIRMVLKQPAEKTGGEP